MAITIIETPSAVDANCYLSLVDAEAFFETRLHTTEWDNASTTDKQAALISATRLIDRFFDWVGQRHVLEQALAWPRDGVDNLDGLWVDEETIPAIIQESVCEVALALLKKDRTSDDKMKGISSFSVGPISISAAKNDPAPIIPDSVVAMLRPYGDPLDDKGRMAVLPVRRS